MGWSSPFLMAFLTLFVNIVASTDLPCAARSIPGESVVCVCNATYCDTVTRSKPSSGTFTAYVTSKGGSRFNNSLGTLETYDKSGSYAVTIKLNVNDTYQKVQGFGGAVTDAASLNWKNVSVAVQDYLIKSYCSSSGLEYTMLRVPIAGTDFSTRPYAYNEYPENDAALSNFTLTTEDLEYKIPMIKACQEQSARTIDILATAWSPPIWMKTNHAWTGISRLKPEYYQTYADYYFKFIEAYKAQGVDTWGVTTTNEPANGVIPLASFNSLGWKPSEFGKWIEENLGPTIRNSTFNETKIIIADDQRYTIPLWFNLMMKERPSVKKWFDGVGVHWYGDQFTPIQLLDLALKHHPDKFVLATEACQGSFPWQLKKVVLGSWSRAEGYAKDIIEDLNHNFVGWVDWNLCLNPQGGPNWDKNFVDAPIIVYSDDDEFIKQPMFYIMGHFSKFVPRGSLRIGSSISGFGVRSVSFLTPDDTVVCIVLNKSGSKKSVRVKVGSKQISLSMEGHSIATVELLKSDVFKIDEEK